MLRSAASFHADQARYSVSEMGQERVAPQLFAMNFSGVRFHRVHLKYLFGDIDANDGFASSIYDGSSG